MKRVVLTFIIVFIALIFYSCNRQFFVEKENVIYQKTGFMVSFEEIDYFVPCKIDTFLTEEIALDKFLNTSFNYGFVVKNKFKQKGFILEAYRKNKIGLKIYYKGTCYNYSVKEDIIDKPNQKCYITPVCVEYRYQGLSYSIKDYTEELIIQGKTINIPIKRDIPDFLDIKSLYTIDANEKLLGL